jgi:subtilisin family serine protease
MLWIHLFTLFSLVFTHSTTAPADQWLVQLRQLDDACLREWAGEADATIRKMPVDAWYVVKVPASRSGELNTLPCVILVVEDKKLDWRATTPNDAQFHNQNDMDLIGMPEAWDVATGGLTQRGDTIVVAIIDEGYQVTHPDLIGNRWFNNHEIADDGIDNDQNGYIDDVEGWNFSTNNDVHPQVNHGTSVAGVIGAKGNNMIGVTGVNWNVEMMMLSGANIVSELVDAYDYILDMRVAYNNSGGTAGAFVVATNLSAGLNFEFASEYPMWCEMYNKLGEAGVLSVSAGPNSSINVEVEGDMPSTCNSQYLIAVTNVDLQDQIVFNAGYGPVSIDIGAPGTGTITTGFSNNYKEFTGTSAAAPHVAGAIALMYSTPCEFFIDGIDEEPEEIAQKVRNIIFQTATPNNSLQEITVHGTRIQVDAAMEATRTNCAPTPDDNLEIKEINPNPAYGDYVDIVFEVIGDTATALMEVHMVNGVKMREFTLSDADFANGLIRMSTVGLPGGIYLVTLRNSEARVTRKVFIP